MSVYSRWRSHALLLIALVSPASATAQTATPPAQTSATPAPAPAAGFQDGFFIQTSDGDNRLLFGVVVQTDGRFSVGDPLPITNTFTIRKVRPTFTGRVARYFDFKVMPDFGNGTTTILDAYVDVRFSPKFRVRSGKDKTQVGYELLQSDAFLGFPERALASSLVPNRDVGIAAQGDLSPKFFYAAGVFNGVNDGASSTTDVDTNDGKDVAGRIVVQPFCQANSTRALSGLGFHIGGSTGTQVGALPTFRTSVGQIYFAYAAGAAANGRRTRVSPAVFVYYKALGVFGEYMRSTQAVTRLTETREITNTAWNVTGSYLLTGEAASYGIVRPRNVFDPPAGKWGALQLVARYSELNIANDVFTGTTFAAAGAADKAKSFTVGVNWFPAAYIKYYATFERTTFDVGTPPARPDENVILFRVQLGF